MKVLMAAPVAPQAPCKRSRRCSYWKGSSCYAWPAWRLRGTRWRAEPSPRSSAATAATICRLEIGYQRSRIPSAGLTHPCFLCFVCLGNGAVLRLRPLPVRPLPIFFQSVLRPGGKRATQRRCQFPPGWSITPPSLLSKGNMQIFCDPMCPTTLSPIRWPSSWALKPICSTRTCWLCCRMKLWR